MSGHDIEMLLGSYNRQCPDCRRAIKAISEAESRRILVHEAGRKRPSRIRIQNAIAIWQQAAKRANARGARQGGEPEQEG